MGRTLGRSKGDGEQPISELLGDTSLRNSLCRRRAPWFMMLAVATQTHVLVLGPPTVSSLRECVDSCPPIPIYLTIRPSAAFCGPAVCSDLLSHSGSCLFGPLPPRPWFFSPTPAQLVSPFQSFAWPRPPSSGVLTGSERDDEMTVSGARAGEAGVL